MTQSKKDRTRYWSEHYLLGQPIVVHLLTLAICIATRAIDIRVVQGLVRDDKTNILHHSPRPKTDREVLHHQFLAKFRVFNHSRDVKTRGHFSFENRPQPTKWCALECSVKPGGIFLCDGRMLIA